MNASHSTAPPDAPVKRRGLLSRESAGGIILMLATALALWIANSGLAEHYVKFLDLPVSIRVGRYKLDKPLLLWVNDGLMAVFFFVVGLELKREVLEGHLSSWRAASLPAFAALGGMLVPAGIYLAFNGGDAGASRGWAIPTATDIAFALGVLSLLGDRVPTSLKVFLLSVAVFDDLGAIIVIAVYYTADLSVISLAVAGVLVLVLAGLNLSRVLRLPAYFVTGVALWIAVLKSGVHATLAGVVLAMFIPLRVGRSRAAGSRGSPLLKLEHLLQPWVAFGVLPMFAFVNAGVVIDDLRPSDAHHPVTLGIVLGLFAGKQLGVLGASWLATRIGWASLPPGVSWRVLHGVAVLCGIGFTMSLFIATLASEEDHGDHLALDRLGILAGSLVSGVLGYALLFVALRRARETTEEPAREATGAAELHRS